jgi:hypothetical protein
MDDRQVRILNLPHRPTLMATECMRPRVAAKITAWYSRATVERGVRGARRPGIFLHTCMAIPGKDSMNLSPDHIRGRIFARRIAWKTCTVCAAIGPIETGQKSVAVLLFVAQTVGIRLRQKSAAQRICFCPQCSVSLAMGPPPEGALNMAAYDMIRELVASDPALNQAAWETRSSVLGSLQPKGTAGLRLSPASGG